MAFIAVLPVEVEDYGPAAAIVIALIRYRTATGGPDRIEREGHRWWRVTHRQLASATGLSPKAVRTALQALGGAVTAKHFAPLANQTLAYRVAKTPNPPTCQLPERADADLPVARAGSPDATGGTPPRPSGHLYLSLETLEKGEEAMSPRADTEQSDSANNEPATPVPAGLVNGLPETPVAVDEPVAPADAGPAVHHPGPEPARRCPAHAHIVGWMSEACGPCGDARKQHTRWAREYEQWRDDERRAIENEIEACTDCGPNGMTDDDPARRCRRHRQMSDLAPSFSTSQEAQR